MSDADRQSLSSAFDAMLSETKRELDGLYGGVLSPAPRDDRPSPRPSLARAPAEKSSDAERFLNDRYGDGWRQEILEQKRDGDEVLVLGKLVIDDQDISKTQFGRARIAGGAPSNRATGSAGGIGFAISAAPGEGRPVGEDAETAAYRAAARDALAKCVAML